MRRKAHITRSFVPVAAAERPDFRATEQLRGHIFGTWAGQDVEKCRKCGVPRDKSTGRCGTAKRAAAGVLGRVIGMVSGVEVSS